VTTEHVEDFCNALGRFIYEFSEVERSIFLYLIITSRIPIQDAKAVFTDARIDKAKQAVKRLRLARNLPDDNKLDCAFNHLADITRLRNDLVHYGPQPQTDQTFVISDDLWKIKNAHTYIITADHLRDATGDLSKLKEFFVKHMLTETVTNVPLIVPLIQNMPEVELLPWRYKPSQPIHPPSNIRPKAPKHPHPPASSGE
jgi:hypothetical protein